MADLSKVPTSELLKSLSDEDLKRIAGVAPARPASFGAEFNPDMYPLDPLAVDVMKEGALSSLPVLGVVGGAAAGTMLGNPHLGAIGGAGLGATAEQYIRSKLPGGDTVPFEERRNDVIGNMILAPTGVGAGKIVNPSVSMTDDAARAAKYAAEHTLPIRLSEVSPSFATTFMDELSTAGFAGRYAELKWAKRGNEYLSRVRNEALGKITGAKDLDKLPIAAIPSKVKPSLNLATEDAYRKPLELVNLEREAASKGWEASRYGSDIPIELTNMRTTAGELMRNPVVQNAKKNRKAKLAPAEWTKEFLDKSNKGLSFEDLHALQKEMNSTLYGAGDANTRMWEAFSKDLSSWDGTIGEQINGMYAVARKKAQMSMKGGMFDTIYGVLRGSTTVDKVTKAEILDGNALYAKLKSPVAGSGNATPETKIITMLGEEKGRPIVQELEDLANYAMHTQNLRREAGGKILDLKTVAGGAATGGAAYGGGILGVLVPQGTSLAMTILLTGPGKMGGLRNYLLKGVRPGLRLGVQGAIQLPGSMMLNPSKGGAIPLRQE